MGPIKKIELDQYKHLNSHFQEKFKNQSWVYSCAKAGIIKSFPYQIADSDSKKAGTVSNNFYYPKKQSKIEPILLNSDTARFIVNIPDGRRPGSTSDEKYSQTLHKLRTETFSTSSSASARMSQSRLAVVIGTNQAESLDPSLNKKFVQLIKKTVPVDKIAARRFGFLWQVQYEKKNNVSCSYSAKKAFFLLKVLGKEIAEKVRLSVEESDGKTHPNIIAQIPFQQIRNVILKENLTRDFARLFQEKAPASPIYLTVMDSDFLSLRKETGVFEKITNCVVKNKNLSVIGCGYSAGDEELPIIQLAVQIDMAVRVAMTSHIPYSAYLPEPCLSVLLKRPNHQPHLKKLSFLGDGHSLESRRLIRNGRDNGAFTDQMTFISDGIVTTSPERWKTPKNQTYKNLSADQIKTKAVLQALRGLSQSHAHPKKWADQVYAAIDFKASQVTDATGPMMHIFSVFDPISRMFARSDTKFSKVTVDQEMTDYEKALNAGQTNLLNTSKTKLLTLGLSKDLVAQIVAAAKASGKAIYEELKKQGL